MWIFWIASKNLTFPQVSASTSSDYHYSTFTYYSSSNRGSSSTQILKKWANTRNLEDQKSDDLKSWLFKGLISIGRVINSKLVPLSPDFKINARWQPLVSFQMVGLLDFRSHLKSRPFANRPLFDHSESWNVWISDTHYPNSRRNKIKIFRKRLFRQPPPEPQQQPEQKQQPKQVPQEPDLDQLQVLQEDHHLKSSKPNLEKPEHQDKPKSQDPAQEQQQRSGQHEQQRHVPGIQIQMEDDSIYNFSPRVTRLARYK